MNQIIRGLAEPYVIESGNQTASGSSSPWRVSHYKTILLILDITTFVTGPLDITIESTLEKIAAPTIWAPLDATNHVFPQQSTTGTVGLIIQDPGYQIRATRTIGAGNVTYSLVGMGRA